MHLKLCCHDMLSRTALTQLDKAPLRDNVRIAAVPNYAPQICAMQDRSGF